MGADEGDAARAYLATQVALLRSLLPAAAAGDDDAVHDARTAARRARTALAVRRPLPDVGGDGAVVRSMEARLRDVGRMLGAVRDPAVELAWLRGAVAAVSATVDTAAAWTRLAESRREARCAALARLRDALVPPVDAAARDAAPTAGAGPSDGTGPCDQDGSPDQDEPTEDEPAEDEPTEEDEGASAGRSRLVGLVDDLDRLAAGLPAGGGRLARRRVRRAWRRLDRALAAARTVPAGPAHDSALHAARRRARTARYAAELVGRPAALRSAALAEAVQEALGAQHDAVLVRACVDAAAQAAADAGEDTDAYAALRRLADDTAARGETTARAAASRALRHDHRHWLR